MSQFFRKSCATLLAFSLFGASLPAHAALLPSDIGQVTVAAASADRAAASAFFARADVQQQLQQLGVSPDEAEARIAALSDDEIRQLNGRLQQAPAGSADVLGLVFTVFIILLVTDILGFTKVFPFTRSLR